MTNVLQVFEYEGNTVRTVEKDDEPWFVAKDVCDILGLTNVSEAIKSLDDDEKMTLSNTEGHSGTRGGAQFINCITESGVYALVFKSRKPEAKAFSRWVRRNVLPQIRKHGMYLSGKLLEIYRSDPEIFDKIVENYASSQKKIVELEKQIADSQSFITLAKVVLGLPGSMTVQEISNFLCQYGNKVGQNRLYKILREKKWLCSRKGRQWNRPTQRSLEQGLCSVEVRNGFRPVTLITPKGLQKITVLFTEENYPLILQMEQE